MIIDRSLTPARAAGTLVGSFSFLPSSSALAEGEIFDDEGQSDLLRPSNIEGKASTCVELHFEGIPIRFHLVSETVSDLGFPHGASWFRLLNRAKELGFASCTIEDLPIALLAIQSIGKFGTFVTPIEDLEHQGSDQAFIVNQYPTKTTVSQRLVSISTFLLGPTALIFRR